MAKDLYHDAVVEAFRKDGWTVTDDPLTITYSTREVFADLGLQRKLVGLERGEQKIAIEIKIFGAASPITDLHRAIGQYVFYDILLKENEPDRLLFLAVDKKAYEGIFSEPVGQLVVERLAMRLVIFDVKQQSLLRWIS